MTTAMLAALSQPTLAKNARMGQPRFVMGKEKQRVGQPPTTTDRLKLVLFDFVTQKWAKLVKTDIGALNWTRDGKYVCFDSGSGLDPAISRVRMADRKVERVTGLKEFRRVEFSYYPWSGLTPDGAPLLLRDVGTQEVYALDFEAP